MNQSWLLGYTAPIGWKKRFPFGARKRHMGGMEETPKLRRGWTTGACATAATKAALQGLWGAEVPEAVEIVLPKGERPRFDIIDHGKRGDAVYAAVIKDAGDDPDVTHGATIEVSVKPSPKGIVFRAGEGVGHVTKPGLPVPPGEPAINPVPRRMMEEEVINLAVAFDQVAEVEITVSIHGGAEIAKQTWNPRLGIEGGLSILGTTGVVRPFSCAAWIASIHRGVDVARANGLAHVVGSTGATSEKAAQTHYTLPDHAMLDMGDFAGGLLKYLRRHPVPRLTISGGIAKLTKLGQGAIDLHSARSQVDFQRLSDWMATDLTECNTVLEAYQKLGAPLAEDVAARAKAQIDHILGDAPIQTDVLVVNRFGEIIGSSA